MIEQTIYWYSIKEYGLPTGINNRKVWMMFKNILSGEFEIYKIKRDYLDECWYVSDCDESVESKSDFLIPIMWTDSFNSTILKTIIKE